MKQNKLQHSGTQIVIFSNFVLMKKILAIFFLSIYLFSATEARELLKLPIIFEHYQEHKLLDSSLTILKFFDIHYMHGSPLDADYARDMQLPFKAISHASMSVFAIPSTPVMFPSAFPLYHKKERPILYNSTAYSFNYHNSIWQPPRAC